MKITSVLKIDKQANLDEMCSCDKWSAMGHLILSQKISDQDSYDPCST